jgi:hypothetical protein
MNTEAEKYYKLALNCDEKTNYYNKAQYMIRASSLGHPEAKAWCIKEDPKRKLEADRLYQFGLSYGKGAPDLAIPKLEQAANLGHELARELLFEIKRFKQAIDASTDQNPNNFNLKDTKSGNINMSFPDEVPERKWWQGGLEFQKAKENMGQIALTPEQAATVIKLKEHADRIGKPFYDFLVDMNIDPKLAKKLKSLVPETENVKNQESNHIIRKSNFANSGLSGWYRLLIVFSVLWSILIYAGMEPWEYSDRKQGYIFIGILPVLVLWGIIWIVKGFRRGKKPVKS